MNWKHLGGAAAVAALVSVGGIAATGAGGSVSATTPPASTIPDATTPTPETAAAPEPTVPPESTVAPEPTAPVAPDPGAVHDRTIVVNGHGAVTVDPDTATISMGVQALAPTSQEAMDTLTTTSNDLIDTLTGVGVAEEDIQTVGLNLWPTYNETGDSITGYQASTNVNVTVRELTRAGEIIDAAAARVGDQLTLGGISFSHSDPEAALIEARTQAVDNARTRAEQYAAAAGVSVGEIVRIIEPSAGTVVPIDARYAGEDAAAPAGAALQPGTLDLTVDITVVYAMG